MRPGKKKSEKLRKIVDERFPVKKNKGGGSIRKIVERFERELKEFVKWL